MKILLRWFVLALLLFLCTSAHEQAATRLPVPLAFTHVTLIDGTGAEPKHDVTVVTVAGKITAIGRNTRLPPHTQVVDGTGKFLLPGLWDMHVHPYAKDNLRLFLANGIVGARIMFGSPEHLQWRKEIKAGTLLGPRLVVGSPIVDGPQPTWPDSIAVANAEQARSAVRNIAQDGYDFVKVYGGLSRDAFFALADEAHKQRIPFAGHIPDAITPLEASDAGQRSMEHLYNLLPGCSTQENQLHQEAQRKQVQWGALVYTKGPQILDTYSEAKAAALFARFRRNRTWQCPTLTQVRGAAFRDQSLPANDPRLKYVPVSIRQGWEAKVPASVLMWGQAFYVKKLQLLRPMQRAGVGLLAGTDMPNPYCLPGFGLHDELALMVQAGLTPVEAIQSATRNPARFLGREKEWGTVQVGKRADLLLLDADPLQDIHNTTRIRAVMADGRLLDRTALDKMLADTEAAAAKP